MGMGINQMGMGINQMGMGLNQMGMGISQMGMGISQMGGRSRQKRPGNLFTRQVVLVTWFLGQPPLWTYPPPEKGPSVARPLNSAR